MQASWFCYTPAVLAATNFMDVGSLASSASSGGLVSRGLVGWLCSERQHGFGSMTLSLRPDKHTLVSPLPVLFSSISCMWILLGVIRMGTGWTMAVSWSRESDRELDGETGSFTVPVERHGERLSWNRAQITSGLVYTRTCSKLLNAFLSGLERFW